MMLIDAQCAMNPEDTNNIFWYYFNQVNHGFSINVEEPSWERKIALLFDRQEALTMRAPTTFNTRDQVCCFTYLGLNKSRSCIDDNVKDSAEKVQFMPKV